MVAVESYFSRPCCFLRPQIPALEKVFPVPCSVPYSFIFLTQTRISLTNGEIGFIMPSMYATVYRKCTLRDLHIRFYRISQSARRVKGGLDPEFQRGGDNMAAKKDAAKEAEVKAVAEDRKSTRLNSSHP